MMVKLVECNNCHTILQLPHGAQSIRCVFCSAVITDTTETRRRTRLLSYMNNSFLLSHGRVSATAGQKIQPPPAFGRKRALIIGITYKKTKYELKGCLNDAKCMKYLLVNRFKFPQDSVLMLTGKILSSITTFFCQTIRDRVRILSFLNFKMTSLMVNNWILNLIFVTYLVNFLTQIHILHIV